VRVGRAGLAHVAAEPAEVTETRPARGLSIAAHVAVVCCYLAIAVVLTWPLWSDPSVRVPGLGAGISNDIYLNDWFMRYAAVAVSHGRLPALVTTTLDWPQGVNAMWNTSFLLPGVLLAPLTLLAGPQVSLTAALTIGFFGSAVSMFFVLRRWQASVSAAAIGGAIYGFSPAVRMAAQDHYHLQFAVLLPLIVHAVLRLLTGRGHPVRTGAWLGLLIAAQLFIAEEMLVDAVLASVFVLVVLVLSRPRQAIRLRRIGGVAAGAGVAVLVTVLLGGHALWVQFHGPLTEQGSPWNIGAYKGVLRDFVLAPNNQLFHGPDFVQFVVGSHQRYSEYFAYLGWPLLIVLLVAAIAGWPDVRIRVAAVACAGLELCSLGANAITFDHTTISARWLPWYWVHNLPVLSQALPNRMSILADAAAAAVFAFSLDRLRGVLPRWRRWRAPVAAVLTAVALLPLIPLIPLPVHANNIVAPPPGWSAAMAKLDLEPGAPVLVLPKYDALTMSWEANTARPFSIVGGYCIAPDSTGHAADCVSLMNAPERQVALDMSRLIRGSRWAVWPSRGLMASALAGWRPAAVIEEDINPASSLGRFLRSYFGPPQVKVDDVLCWRVGPPAWHALARD
jgi:hypothetical protein